MAYSAPVRSPDAHAGARSRDACVPSGRPVEDLAQSTQRHRGHREEEKIGRASDWLDVRGSADGGLCGRLWDMQHVYTARLLVRVQSGEHS